VTARDLRRLSDLLLKLYESLHAELSPAEENAVTQLRDFIYEKGDRQ